jgi:hypothetical protein
VNEGIDVREDPRNIGNMCPICRQWAARTREQLNIRLRNLRESGDSVTAYRCYDCGGRAWATTEEFLPPEPAYATSLGLVYLVAALIVSTAIVAVVAWYVWSWT